MTDKTGGQPLLFTIDAMLTMKLPRERLHALCCLLEECQ